MHKERAVYTDAQIKRKY